MLRMNLGPASQKTVTNELMSSSAILARKYEGVRLHTHLAENQVSRARLGRLAWPACCKRVGGGLPASVRGRAHLAENQVSRAAGQLGGRVLGQPS